MTNPHGRAAAARVIPLAAITDEFSPDVDVALSAMENVGMTGAELRVVSGRNILDLSDAEVDRVSGVVRLHGMQVLSIASPLLKCELPGAPPVDPRLQQDIFGSPYTFQDQERLSKRAFEVADSTGARIIRVFSYWRTVDPAACFDGIVTALRGLADRAADRGLIIGIENEPACNIGTGRETARLLAALDHPALKVVWDPANAMVLGETPYPDGYGALPAARIVHVHAKDCRVEDFKPEWGPIGDLDVDWNGQLDALLRDGYSGWLSLETHWRGPNGDDKLEASRICGERLRDLVQAAAARHATGATRGSGSSC
jgi:L-ribulose-5-phosphate 3-epimerase